MLKKWVNEFHGLALVHDEVGWQSCPYREINSKRDVLLSRVIEWEYWTSLKHSLLLDLLEIQFLPEHSSFFLKSSLCLPLILSGTFFYLESSSMFSIIYWGMKVELGKPLLKFQCFVPISPPQNFPNLFVCVCVSHIFIYFCISGIIYYI